jgi:hypothetical protein
VLQRRKIIQKASDCPGRQDSGSALAEFLFNIGARGGFLRVAAGDRSMGAMGRAAAQRNCDLSVYTDCLP